MLLLGFAKTIKSLLEGKENIVKSLQICFALLVAFSLLVSCNFRNDQPAIVVETPTPFVPTVTASPSITPIPAPTQRDTITPVPTSTRPPSLTPPPLLSPIPSKDLLTIQAQVTKARFVTKLGPYQCKILSTQPEELDIYRPKEEFQGIWRLLNVGEAAWQTDNIAYFYISGTKFQTRKYKEDFIPYVVNVDDQLNLHVPMRAPAEPGVYFTIWGLRIKNLKQFFCTFSISIRVIEKYKK